MFDLLKACKCLDYFASRSLLSTGPKVVTVTPLDNKLNSIVSSKKAGKAVPPKWPYIYPNGLYMLVPYKVSWFTKSTDSVNSFDLEMWTFRKELNYRFDHIYTIHDVVQALIAYTYLHINRDWMIEEYLVDWFKVLYSQSKVISLQLPT